ncbi:hypothetical protein AAEO50_12240 [Rossellomorea oryzaecorticis]|uniref:HTH cro/C1-type domain-containing protein n=1 Tax=Rossellomorea oryzaecorticis TaxID=1396505 RepID=A0ABU9KAD0_9BACI
MKALAHRTIKRDKYILENHKVWKKQGAKFKKKRVDHGFPLQFVAAETGMAPATLKKYEEGMPVIRPKLIEKSLEHFYKYWEIRSSLKKILKKHDWD